MKLSDPAELDQLDFTKGGGLVPVVAQHGRTGEVLMLGYADRESLQRSLETGALWFFSRSRGQLWHKGESSGHTLSLLSLHADCDRDAVVAQVEPAGPTCHTGERSCFGAPPTLTALADVLDARAATLPEGSYTTRLLADRNLRLKKLAEEAAEVAMACMEVSDPGSSASAEDRGRVAGEAADLLYHLLVACRAAGVGVDDVLRELDNRRGR